MEARAEQSKNRILAEIRGEVTRVEREALAAVDQITVVTLVIVMVLLIIVAAITQSWILFLSVFAYVVIVSFIYLQFSHEYARRRLHNAGHTLTNFISSEEVLIILNNAAVVYNTTPG